MYGQPKLFSHRQGPIDSDVRVETVEAPSMTILKAKADILALARMAVYCGRVETR